MYSTVEDLFLWNQALSSKNLLPDNFREQLFRPELNNWACGCFVTKIPPGAAGAGITLAEMRGDMPGNFFAWILRFPEQDAVIIVLRNGYGSTEHLEEKLQAILFDQRPKLPSRNGKDIAAHVWLVSYSFFASQPTVTVGSIVLVVAGFAYVVNRRKHNRRPAAVRKAPPACATNSG